MAKRDILKEAIADAKAVKETAIANAKAALEEAFTPQLKSMLAAKLEEMELEEEMSSSTRGEDGTRPPRREEDDTKSKKKMEESDEIEEEMDKKKEVEEELDLDEILKEIEGELNEEESVNEEETVTEDESEAERADVDKFEFEKGKEEGEEDEKEELDLEDMTDEDLKGFIEDVIADMVAAGELEAGESSDVEIETEETEEIELEEEITEEKEEEEKKVTKEEVTEEAMDENSIAEVYKEKYSKELEEANAKIKALEESNKVKDIALNEVNLLNAKLLYTNKIFKAKSLTENEKVKVLGAFDKATTVKETKLVFETLNEGLKRKKSTIKESLGSASKATGNFKNTKNPIVETDPMVERFKKLAGLK